MGVRPARIARAFGHFRVVSDGQPLVTLCYSQEWDGVEIIARRSVVQENIVSLGPAIHKDDKNCHRPRWKLARIADNNGVIADALNIVLLTVDLQIDFYGS